MKKALLNPPLPLELFRKFIRFGGATCPFKQSMLNAILVGAGFPYQQVQMESFTLQYVNAMQYICTIMPGKAIL